MRVLAFDTGATNLGWASVGEEDGHPYYHMSGIVKSPRKEMPFQEYREALTAELTYIIPDILALTSPDEVVTETIPASLQTAQSYLANTVATIIHVTAFTLGYPVNQISARTVHSCIAIGNVAKKTSKVMVRNGVLELLPELQHRKKEWTKAPWDEVDAIAIGLCKLGFTNK